MLKGSGYGIYGINNIKVEFTFILEKDNIFFLDGSSPSMKLQDFINNQSIQYINIIMNKKPDKVVKLK